MKTCALIAAYNEEKTIKKVVFETLKYVDELIVVDDGSTDKTFSIISNIKNKKLEIVSYPINKGKGYALRQGFKKFLEIGGNILVTLDADLQHNPKEINHIINLIKDDVSDVVIGSRYMKTMPRAKVFLNVLANINLLLASGTFFSDVSSGYRAYSKKAIEKILPRLTLDRFGIELEILKACVDGEMRVGIIPVGCDYKFGKKANLGKLFKGHFQFAWKYKKDIFNKLVGIK